MATHSVHLPEKSQGQRSLVGYSPWGRLQSDTTEGLSTQAPYSPEGKPPEAKAQYQRQEADWWGWQRARIWN